MPLVCNSHGDFPLASSALQFVLGCIFRTCKNFWDSTLQFVLGCIFRTCKNFWSSAESNSSFYPKNSYKYKTSTAITSIVDSAFAESRADSMILHFACEIL